MFEWINIHQAHGPKVGTLGDGVALGCGFGMVLEMDPTKAMVKRSELLKSIKNRWSCYFVTYSGWSQQMVGHSFVLSFVLGLLSMIFARQLFASKCWVRWCTWKIVVHFAVKLSQAISSLGMPCQQQALWYQQAPSLGQDCVSPRCGPRHLTMPTVAERNRNIRWKLKVQVCSGACHMSMFGLKSHVRHSHNTSSSNASRPGCFGFWSNLKSMEIYFVSQHTAHVVNAVYLPLWRSFTLALAFARLRRRCLQATGATIGSVPCRRIWPAELNAKKMNRRSFAVSLRGYLPRHDLEGHSPGNHCPWLYFMSMCLLCIFVF